MITSIYIKSESGDSVMFLYNGKSVQEIDDDLCENMYMFSPICDYMVETLDTEGNEKEQLEYMLEKLVEKSWA